MKVFKIYLSGPISGLTYNESDKWADEAKDKLHYIGSGSNLFQVVGYRPLRYNEYTLDGKRLDKNIVYNANKTDTVNMNPTLTDRAIVSRDRYDVITSDVLLVNLLGAKEKSIGTMFEMAWAYEKRIPIVCIIEENNIHDHPFVRESIDYRVDNLNDAVEMIHRILMP